MLKIKSIPDFNKEALTLNVYHLIIHRSIPLSLVFQEITSDQPRSNKENDDHIYTFNLPS